MSLRHLEVLFWIAASMLLFELALEARASSRGWETLLFGGPSGVTEGPEFGPRDDFPFRSRVVPRDPGAGELRIWTASSSYGADAQLATVEVFPNLIGDELAAGGRPVVTLNASVDGHTIAHNVVELNEYGPLWRPDVVVLYQMSNDIDLISTGLRTGERLSIGAGESAGGPNLIQRLFEETTAFKNLKTQVTSRLTKARVLLDDMGEQGEREFEAYVHDFLAAVRELGAKPVLCTFATSYVSATIDGLPSGYEHNLLRFNIHLSIEGWLDSIDRFNLVLERIAGEEGVPLVDAASALAGQPEHFRDFWHLRPEGHRIVARLIASKLNELGLD